jgi:hypothetical protein
MPEDTHDLASHKDMIQSILHAADEKMLRESGNEVYGKLKAEVDSYRFVYLFTYFNRCMLI